METLKRWFGWGAQPGQEYQHRQQQQQAGQWTHKRPVAAAAAEQPVPPPVVCDRPSGDGGIQGLDWFRHSLLRDVDGDCAHTFLEEEVPQCRAQQAGAAAVQLRPPGNAEQRQQHHDGQRGQQRQPQQRQAALQCTSRGAQRVGPSDMLVDRGNVYVVPHSDDP
ncbi:hypothetical protein ABPG75_013568 [Micractinium tetrahymenae]